ncbi:hypothetical protein B0H13DRAFT_1930191 [Mycena leptocephala]|nr:hypothetical protein B0H13DRAFT_1930191 [Mycena leptocephala]
MGCKGMGQKEPRIRDYASVGQGGHGAGKIRMCKKTGQFQSVGTFLCPGTSVSWNSGRKPQTKETSGSVTMTSETSVLLEDGDGDRMFIVMRETLDYAIGIVLRRLTAI